ncbi:NADPH-dependent F420 reductase [Pseudomonas shirazensis]
MKIGIIGAGFITMDFAHRAAESGHEVLISNPRGTNTLKEIAQKMGRNVKLVSTHEAANAEIIILFIPREDLKTSIDNLPDMSGKTVLHTNNPIINLQSFLSTVSGQSSCDIVTCLLPDAHVIKIFNTIEPPVALVSKKHQERPRIFYAGENRKAKNNVKVFLETLNFSGVDLAGFMN